MSSSVEADKSELLERASALGSVGGLLPAYYRHVAPEDVTDRSEKDLYGALASQYKLASERPQGTASIRVFTPTVGADGWSAESHSVVEVVTDDMPFLVDSVTMELGVQERDVHIVVHPTFEVERDITGALVDVLADDGGELPPGHLRESWMHVEIDRLTDPKEARAIEERLRATLRDVREAVEDWSKMQTRMLDIVEELREEPPAGIDADEVEQSGELLHWFADDHFTMLGYREYTLNHEDGEEYLRAVPGTGLGILRSDQDMASHSGKLPPLVAARARDKNLLVLAKANSRATVHRPAYLDYVGVKTFDDAGEVIGERRFLGLFSSAAYTESLTRIPLLREKAAAVQARVGFDPNSHAGKALMDTLENYPRDELFQTPVEELAPVAQAVMYTRERRQVRLFLRRDLYGRFLSCLVYLPRDQYNTAVRERMAQLLKDRLGGETVEFTTRINESNTARVHFVVRPPRGQLIDDVDTGDLERRLTDAARSWEQDFVAAVLSEYGEENGSRLHRAYAGAFPEAYKEDFDPRTAAADLDRLEGLSGETDIDLMLYEPLDIGEGEARLKVFRLGRPLSLSEILPMLSSMGVEVVDERPYKLEHAERPLYVYEFGLRYPGRIDTERRRLFQDALRSIWDGNNEIDGFNALVLGASLDWRQSTVLRAYAKYMRQGGTPFAQDYIEGALQHNVEIARHLVRLFETRFDPALAADTRPQEEAAVENRILGALDDVASLDQDRILRSYLTIINATMRTNFYQMAEQTGATHRYLSFKLEPSAIPELPEPRPRHEIFVYSSRVEGVHLRFGAVARGGLRWSDRRDDFRTEVLGLVKAQMVKNTVIVPVGAKGGFFCKRLPDPSDREAWLAEGIACYRIFISGLLDITDNLVGGETVPPADVVRHDGDDSYLVVAADKGTATFSDIANGVSKDYGFWLGDAFASGGSVGYDHKAMGITARGAWVSVQRHFRERGIDCQTEGFTAVGIGDMSGDVFGNGMLCSEHTRLVAAFDHRDIFIDPTPDAATSYAERRRLFDLPRSSWADYDTSLISTGGGVFSRSAKSIRLNETIRTALGIDEGTETMTPNDLMRAILCAPVDLLWNGGIGTYVKAASETNAEVGDKANDAIRVNGRDLRVDCVGEGGNLGLTQLGRIEYAMEGGRLNTDFIDNSAGVDTSDREVNIKILLDQVVRDGDLTLKQRNTLLAQMTDDVSFLVLRDNYEQNLALANADANAVGLLHVHEDWMRQLEKRGVLNRDLEGLPSSRQMRRRLDRGAGLTVPELSVLLSWTKIVLAEELLDSDLPDDPYLRSDLIAYFPQKMRQAYRERMADHPLRREIIVTQIVNDLVNGAGMTFWPRLQGETGASPAELTRANFVAREIFGSLVVREKIAAFDNQLPASVQTRMRLEMRTLVERASRWLVNNRRPPLDSEATVDFFSVPVQRVLADLPDLMSGRESDAFAARRDALIGDGVPEDLAIRVACLPPAYAVLGVVEIADRMQVDAGDVARLHFALWERLGLPVLMSRVLTLPRDDRWQTMARAALRDDVYAVQSQLVAQVLASTDPEDSVTGRIAAWEEADSVVVSRAVTTLEQICADDQADLARMSVGLRVIRGLLATGG